MKTFRTEAEAVAAGYEIAQMGYAFKRGAPVAERRVRILSPETLKCVEVIEELEWEWDSRHVDYFCCQCNRRKENGHAPDCKLDLALRAVGVR